MSLLDKGNTDVVVFMEEVVTDRDDNLKTKPSVSGITTRARIQVQNQSGTAARRREQDNEGFESEKTYTMRLPRSWSHGPLGAQSEVEWPAGSGDRWALAGDVDIFNGSPRTAHFSYTIKRY